MKRALGIDYGTKRIGLALSDEFGWNARPLEVWHHKSLAEDLKHISELIREHEIGRIVVGVPHRLDGSPGTLADRAQAFIFELKEAFPTLSIKAIDEALTTFEAEEILKAQGIKADQRKNMLDAYAAAVILQEDLDLRAHARPK